MADVEDFIQGSPSAAMTSRLGLHLRKSWRERRAKEVAIGILIGVLISG